MERPSRTALFYVSLTIEAVVIWRNVQRSPAASIGLLAHQRPAMQQAGARPVQALDDRQRQETVPSTRSTSQKLPGYVRGRISSRWVIHEAIRP